MIEALESRRLLSAGGIGKGAKFDPGAYGPADASLANGVLTVNNAHDVQINDYDGNDPSYYPPLGTVYVVDKSGGGASGVTTVFSGVTSLIVNGTKGGDIISVSVDDTNNTFSTVVYGNGGGDAITVANKGSSTLIVYAGAANDTVYADNTGSGSTTVYGEGGHDSFFQYIGGAVFYQ